MADREAQKWGCYSILGDTICCAVSEDIQWTVGGMTGSLSFPMVSAGESLAHLCASKQHTVLLYYLWERHQAKHLSCHSTFPLLYKEEEKKRHKTTALSISKLSRVWMYDPSVGLCTDDDRNGPGFTSSDITPAILPLPCAPSFVSDLARSQV